MLVVVSRHFFNASSPRLGAENALDASTFALIARAPTMWWSLDIALLYPTLLVAQRLPLVCSQLRRIAICGHSCESAAVVCILASAGSSFARTIREIDLADFRMTDDVLAELRGVTGQLEKLSLGMCGGVTDAGMRHLGGMCRLRSLLLRVNSTVTDSGLAPVLRDATRLQSLAVTAFGAVTGEVLGGLHDGQSDSGRDELRELALASCARLNGGVLADRLRPLRALTTLIVTCCQRLSTLPFDRLTRAPASLTHLDLSSNSCGDGPLDTARWSCRSLVYCDVRGNAFTGGFDLASLPPQLTELGASYNAFTGSVDLTRLPATLRVLWLGCNGLDGPIDLTALPGTLEVLHLPNNRFSGHVALTALPPRLEKLWLNDNAIDSVAFDTNRVPCSLSVLRVMGRRRVTGASAAQLPAHVVNHDFTSC